MSPARRRGSPTWVYRWTREEDALLRRVFPHSKTADFLPLFPAHDAQSINNRAHRLRLYKTDECWDRTQAENRHYLIDGGKPYRFQPGHVSAHSMKGRPATGRARETVFKKGNRPHTWQPVGSTRVDREGYTYVKVQDLQEQGGRNYRPAHVIVWERQYGPIPAGHVVVFVDGDKSRITLGNLECVSRAELMARNSIHRASMPESVRGTLQLLAGLKGRITKLEKKRAGQEQGQTSKQRRRERSR